MDYDRVWIRPNIMLGKPCIKGTRIPVYILLQHLASGSDYAEIKKQYPGVTDENIRAALAFSAAYMENDIATLEHMEW